MNIEVNKGDFREALIFAFRYALGRSSMAPFGVTNTIKEYIHIFSEFDKEQMIRDIEQAVQSNNAGMACDIALWEDFAALLRNTLKEK